MAEVARCRVCEAELQHGQCPACKWRAARYAKVLVPERRLCECGAPARKGKAGSKVQPKYCEPCMKLRTREYHQKASAGTAVAKGSRRG